MLSERRLANYADVLLWGLEISRGEAVHADEIVELRFDAPALDLAEVLYEKLAEKGAHVEVRLRPTPRMERSFHQNACRKQLIYKTPGSSQYHKRLGATISIPAPESLTHLADIDPSTVAERAKALRYIREIHDERELAGHYSWTLGLYPTKTLADAADMSLMEYSDQIARACHLDSAEPLAEWKRLRKQLNETRHALKALEVDALRIETANMRLNIAPGEKRRWLGLTGHNIPSFEIYTSPDWRFTDGTFYADLPSFRQGNYVEAVRLTFKKGILVKAEADKGADYLIKQLRMDEGSSRVGEFSLTDARWSRINRFMASTLYDENFGGEHGNCHLALGSSYSGTYDGDDPLTAAKKKQLGLNSSAMHWDLINTEPKTVTASTVSGKEVLLYENGRFVFDKEE
jgi:aminopeptidase